MKNSGTANKIKQRQSQFFKNLSQWITAIFTNEFGCKIRKKVKKKKSLPAKLISLLLVVNIETGFPHA